MAKQLRDWLTRRGPESAASRWAAVACNGLAVAILAGLTACYAISDRHWLGAAWGIWPPWFWSPGLVVLAVLGYRRDQARVTVALLVATGLFCIGFSEVWLVIRRPYGEARRAFRRAHEALTANPTARDGAVSSRGLPLRVISWNLNGLPGGPETSLAELARYRPDLCFLQEAWRGEQDLPRPAIDEHLAGYTRLVEPDCGLLSRYPATPLRSIPLSGPVRALAADIQLPGPRRITCVCVHLPLLPLRLAVHRRAVRQETRAAVAERKRMMERLIEAVRIHVERGPVIVAGDWNTPASAGSLRPLRAVLRDAFLYGGSGWGNTMTNEFPVSRIDAIFVSSEFGIAHCAAHRSNPSDHRLLEAELWLRP